MLLSNFSIIMDYLNLKKPESLLVSLSDHGADESIF